jgi:hypothetical protein
MIIEKSVKNGIGGKSGRGRKLLLAFLTFITSLYFKVK